MNQDPISKPLSKAQLIAIHQLVDEVGRRQLQDFGTGVGFDTDYRKKEKSNDGIELVKSTMLEWWRVDLSSLNLDFEYAQIPAWRLKFDDGEEKILHSHNGMTYNL